MNASKFILLAGLFAFITAEFSFAQNTPTPTATVEPDQIKSFKELVARVPTRSSGKSIIHNRAYGYDIDIMDVTFDVKKTDSLINPVIGIINFTAKETHPNPLEERKKYRLDPNNIIYLQMQMVFHWQGDHWKFERIWNRENGVDFSSRGEWGEAMSDFLKSVQ